LTLCREWTLVKNYPEYRLAKPLKCRSWGCELCAPVRKAQLLAKAAAGLPNRFITLTVNPRVGENEAARLALLANAWRLIIKRLRRLHPKESIEFLAVVEATKAGEPHLHVLFRGPYIPQKLLSTWMNELTESPIVDIRKIRNQKEVVRYVAKYITKAPAQFGSRKRYWSSGRWEPKYEPKTLDGSTDTIRWSLVREPMSLILHRWIHEGFAPRIDHHDVLIGLPLNRDYVPKGTTSNAND